MEDKKALIIIANRDFNDQEFQEMKEFFEDEAIETRVVNSSGNDAEGSGGLKAIPDYGINRTTVDDYDILVIIGGSGIKEYYSEDSIIDLIKAGKSLGKIIVAFDVASGLLAISGIVSGKKITGSLSIKPLVEKSGAVYTGKKLEIDDKIITAINSESMNELKQCIIKIF